MLGYDAEMRGKVLGRLQQITHLQALIDTCLQCGFSLVRLGWVRFDKVKLGYGAEMRGKVTGETAADHTPTDAC